MKTDVSISKLTSLCTVGPSVLASTYQASKFRWLGDALYHSFVRAKPAAVPQQTECLNAGRSSLLGGLLGQDAHPPSHLTEQALQVFSIRSATVDAEEVRPYRNFLIVAPEPNSDLVAVPPPDERVTVLAHQLNQNGFAYVARSNQKEMEDDSSGVRYLPLRESLPSFGVLTAVIVIGDPAWAARAAATYPETDVFLLKLPD